MLEYQLKNKASGPATFNLALYGMRIVFMGTPEFAVASLDALKKAGFNIVGVVTAPDKLCRTRNAIAAKCCKKICIGTGS
jgi:methionyl-tRNA formyltransferase